MNFPLFGAPAPDCFAGAGAEADGWVVEVSTCGRSVLSGKEVVPLPDGYGIRNSAGEEIVNAMAGLRFGFGDNGDIYSGIGHSLAGDAWMEWFWRVEFRVRF